MYKESFISYLRFEKHYSVHTLTAYEKEIDQFLAFADQESYTFDAIDFKFLRYYFSTLRESKKEARSINRSISALKSYYKYMLREGLVDRNPMSLIKALKVPQKLPTVVEKEKMVSLLDQMDAEVSSFEDLRDFIVLQAADRFCFCAGGDWGAIETGGVSAVFAVWVGSPSRAGSLVCWYLKGGGGTRLDSDC